MGNIEHRTSNAQQPGKDKAEAVGVLTPHPGPLPVEGRGRTLGRVCADGWRRLMVAISDRRFVAQTGDLLCRRSVICEPLNRHGVCRLPVGDIQQSRDYQPALPKRTAKCGQSLLTSAAMLLSALVIGFMPMMASAAQAEVKDVSINGGVQDGKARIVIEGQFGPLTSEKEKVLFATAIQHSLLITREKHVHTINVVLDILRGEPTELPLIINGQGEIKEVTGANLLDWSVRQENGARVLVLRPRKTDKPLTQLIVSIQAEQTTRLLGTGLQKPA